MEKRAGFTLIELMIAMTIAAVVLAGVYMSYLSQQKSYVIQDQVSAMQQNLRAAMDMMERDIRMAGLDPIAGMGAGNFGITSVANNAAGNVSLRFTEDLDGSGVSVVSGVTVVDNNEDITFELQASGTGTFNLVRIVNGTGVVANNMQALAFAYAYDSSNPVDGILEFVDNNGDGQCDVGEIIWAIDSDNDNSLDLNLDTDGNGVIDANDDQNTDGILEGRALPGGAIVPMNRIKAVRIWLLARTDRPIQGFLDTKTYVMGNRSIIPAGTDSNHMHRLLTTTVRCRNL